MTRFTSNPTPAEFAAWRMTHPPMAGADGEDRLAGIAQELSALQQRAESAVATVETNNGDAAEAKSLLQELAPKIELLTGKYNEELRATEVAAMKAQVTDMKAVLEDLKKPGAEWLVPGTDSGTLDAPTYAFGQKALTEQFLPGDYDATTAKLLFSDIRLANRGDSGAKERLTKGLVGQLTPEGKAMTEGTNSQGGYLVQPQIERRIIEAIESDNVLRGLCSKLNITTNSIQLDQLTLSTTAGWVAELAQKPETTGMSIASVSASVFTAAGLATISNQLLADSNPAVDQLVLRDLVKRLTALEETAFLAGTGTGQPLGLLNTPGLGASPLTSTVVVDLVDQILKSIEKVLSAHGTVSAILMHPRTWTRILLSKNATTGDYNIDPTRDMTESRTFIQGPTRRLWGYPVVLTNRMPTNLGGGTESRVVVGDFSEALILDREGVAIDESPHVYFTTNQTVFRAEKRVGFTAARTPEAFDIIGGAGLAAG